MFGAIANMLMGAAGFAVELAVATAGDAVQAVLRMMTVDDTRVEKSVLNPWCSFVRSAVCLIINPIVPMLDFAFMGHCGGGNSSHSSNSNSNNSNSNSNNLNIAAGDRTPMVEDQKATAVSHDDDQNNAAMIGGGAASVEAPKPRKGRGKKASTRPTTQKTSTGPATHTSTKKKRKGRGKCKE